MSFIELLVPFVLVYERYLLNHQLLNVSFNIVACVTLRRLDAHVLSKGLPDIQLGQTNGPNETL